MRLEVRNCVDMLGKSVVAEVKPSSPERRKWLRIRPLAVGLELLQFEHCIEMDTDDYPSPNDIFDRFATTFDSWELLLDELNERGIDSNLFDVPWKTDYPL